MATAAVVSGSNPTPSDPAPIIAPVNRTPTPTISTPTPAVISTPAPTPAVPAPTPSPSPPPGSNPLPQPGIVVQSAVSEQSTTPITIDLPYNHFENDSGTTVNLAFLAEGVGTADDLRTNPQFFALQNAIPATDGVDYTLKINDGSLISNIKPTTSQVTINLRDDGASDETSPNEHIIVEYSLDYSKKRSYSNSPMDLGLRNPGARRPSRTIGPAGRNNTAGVDLCRQHRSVVQRHRSELQRQR